MLLAGPSCSGKTELSRELQSSLPDRWLIWAADVSQPRFPGRDEFVTIEADLLMVGANLRSVRAYLESGFNVIVELFIWDTQRVALAEPMLAPFDALVVRLDCSADTLELRERLRGTTYVGLARQQLDALGWNFPADLVLNTERCSPRELAGLVGAWLATDPIPSALGSMERHD
ncbi:MAG: phosphotransferase-like protein [Actinomycetota bacterium]